MFPQIDMLSQTYPGKLLLIAGPCVIENEQMAFDIAQHLKQTALRYDIPFIFKASYRKANRSRIDSFTGIGDEKALNILRDIRKTLSVPVVTDIHSVAEAQMAARYVDVLQIPAFLCRQTDLLEAAAKTGKVVNIKKGQFLSAEAMKFAVEKVRNNTNQNVMLTERGTSFGYSDLIVDFRSIPEMKKNNCPVIVDITHSLQQPNRPNGVTGGQPQLIETIARAAVACGADGVFVETHHNPAIAKSDGANMLPLHLIDNLISNLVKIKQLIETLDHE
jgi:2-dehydro-3-deoxyphosphooctonate aldolase (KDO 8-P synthase)